MNGWWNEPPANPGLTMIHITNTTTTDLDVYLYWSRQKEEEEEEEEDVVVVVVSQEEEANSKARRPGSVASTANSPRPRSPNMTSPAAISMGILRPASTTDKQKPPVEPAIGELQPTKKMMVMEMR